MTSLKTLHQKMETSKFTLHKEVWLQIILSILLLSLAGIVTFFILINYLLQRVFHIPHISYERTPELMGWKAKDHRAVTEHEKRIQLWELNPGSEKPPLLFTHGWANASDCFFGIVPVFLENWNVFLLNTRNHGDSDDDKYASILQYRRDILAASDFIVSQPSVYSRIFLVGHSLGAAASLYAAAKDERVAGVVSIASFSNMEKFMYHWLRNHRLPKALISGMIRFIEFRVGVSFSDISPDQTIETYKGPVLIVHGTHDQTVPFKALQELYKSANRDNVEILKLKGHSHSSMLNDKQVAIDIERFLRKQLQTTDMSLEDDEGFTV